MHALLAPGLSPHANLHTLSLLDNQLSTLPDLSAATPRLGSLRLDRNNFCLFPEGLGRLKCLRLLTLSAQRTVFRELPARVSELSALRVLDVSKNYIRSLPVELALLRELRQLDVGEQRSESWFRSTPMHDLPVQACRSPTHNWRNIYVDTSGKST